LCARRDEGAMAEGYTVDEAVLMARSSVVGQRVAALRLLAAVLAQASTRVAGNGLFGFGV
jgi:RPAP1-like, C-terminal